MTSITGSSTQFRRVADSGKSLTFQFCPVCGSTVYFEAELFPGLLAVTVGSFADPDFPAPKHSVWEKRRHSWAEAFGELPIKRSN